MSNSWPRLYGSKSSPDHDFGEYQAVRQEEYTPRFDHDPLPKRATRCWIITASILVVSIIVMVLTIGVTVEKPGLSPVRTIEKSLEESATPAVSGVSTTATGKQIVPAEDCHINNVKVRATNEYGEYRGPYPFLTKTGNEMLVEPYKSTLLELTGLDCSYVTLLWEIRSSDSKIIFSATTTTATTSILLKSTGKYTITVSKSDTRKTGRRQGIRSFIFSGTLYCK